MAGQWLLPHHNIQIPDRVGRILLLVWRESGVGKHILENILFIYGGYLSEILAPVDRK